MVGNAIINSAFKKLLIAFVEISLMRRRGIQGIIKVILFMKLTLRKKVKA